MDRCAEDGEDQEEENVECELCGVEDEPSEESHKLSRVKRIPKAPSDHEREEHDRIHLPYRSWCPSCVAGRGVADGHFSQEKEERSIPGMDFDYCFLRNHRGEDYAPVLVSKDRNTSMLGAHVVPCKGAQMEWVQKQVVRDLQKVGHYGQVVLKCDQEPALIDVLREAAKLRSPAETIFEHSPVDDSQSNGFIERGVRTFEEQLRVLKLDLERRVEARIAVNSNALAWLVEHTADVLNKFQIGKDGKSRYERAKGKRYLGEVLRFGQPVMLRVTGKVQGGLMTERWVEGIWLGKRFHSDEHIVCRTSDGEVVRTRSVKSLPCKVTMELLDKIKGVPWAPTSVHRQDGEVRKPVLKPEETKGETLSANPRSMRITAEMVDKHGYSKDCKKCRAMSRGDNSQPALGHSSECRIRIEGLLGSDERFGERLRETEARKTRFYEGEIKRSFPTIPASTSSSSSSSAAAAADIPEEVNIPEAAENPEEVNAAVKRKPDITPGEDDDVEPPSSRPRLFQLVQSLHVDVEDNPEAESMLNPGFWEEVSEQHVTAYDPMRVQKAKQDELRKFKEMKVYEVVRREDMTMWPDASKVGVTWVLTDKQSGLKARLVAQEFASKRIDRDSLFAGTPGLNAMRLVISDVASKAGEGYRLLVGDIKSAFLYGWAKRNIFIELPPEDPMSSSGSFVGRLLKAMYGTRDAPQVWADHLGSILCKIGFQESVYMPGVFLHQVRKIKMAVHVDDLLASGLSEELEWLVKSLLSEFEMKHEILGPDAGQKTEVEYLGRRIAWTSEGIVIEGDSKHARNLLKVMGMETCRSSTSPFASKEEVDGSPVELSSIDARKYRGAAALISYMAQDRPDLSVVACFLAEGMAKPCTNKLASLKRAVRYIQGVPTVQILLEWQAPTEQLYLYTDSDWATCKETRKSHSGGVLLLGKHLISHWCRIQPRVALSSGEAELYSSVRGLSNSLGTLHLMRDISSKDWGELSHYVDATACKSILMRKGAGSIKHLETKYLWVQDAIRREKVKVSKVPREDNPSDSLASISSPKVLWYHMDLIGVHAQTDRL